MSQLKFFTNCVFMLSVMLLSAVSGKAGHGDLQFVKNEGQENSKVQFSAYLPGGQVFLEKNKLSFTLFDPFDVGRLHDFLALKDSALNPAEEIIHMHGFEMLFAGSAADNTIGLQQKSSHHNFFKGKNPTNWASDVPVFEEVLYENLYPGIDFKVSSSETSLKSFFYLKAGANASSILWEINGAQSKIEEGELIIQTSVAEIVDLAPVAWQFVNGKKINIPINYRKIGEHFGFDFPEGFDSKFPLIIDPELIWSSLSGSVGQNWGLASCPGPDGSLFAAAVSFEPGYPTTIGAYQTNFAGGNRDLAITRFSADGSSLLYSTLIGGVTGEDEALSLVSDSLGNVHIFGLSNSTDLPMLSNAYDPTANGMTDIFLIKLNSNGNQLLGTTYLGGIDNDGNPRMNTFNSGERGEIEVDDEGFVYIGSSTVSSNFPITSGAYSNSIIGYWDGIACKLSPNLDVLEWSTFIGGNSTDCIYAIELDVNKNLYVSGGTFSKDYPVTAGAVQDTHGGNWDGFVSLISKDGTALLASTLLGTWSYDQCQMMTTDRDGNVFLTGQTMGPFPVTAGTYSIPNGSNFICELDPMLSTRIFSTVFGSGRVYPDLTPTAFAVDTCNRIYYSSWAQFQSPWLFRIGITPDAYQQNTDSRNFYMMVMEEGARGLLYGTYFGGKPSQEHSHARCNHFDEEMNLYQVGCSGCVIIRLAGGGGLPSSPKPVSHIHINGYNDFPVTDGAFATKNLSAACNMVAFKMKFNFQDAEGDLEIQYPDNTCPGATLEFKADGGQFYEWTLPDGSVSSQDSIALQFDTPGLHKIEVIVQDTTKCNPFDTVWKFIQIHDLPVIDAGMDINLCVPTQIQLQANGAIQYQWSPILKLNDATISNPVSFVQNNTRFTVMGIDANGCEGSDEISIHFNPTKAHFSHSPKIPGNGEPIYFQDGSTIATNWYWDFGDGKNSVLQSPIHQYAEDGIYEVKLVVENGPLCSDTLVRVIEIYSQPKLFFPNAFSPNSDGLNDVFIPIGKKISDYQLEVFDRYGRLIFITNDLAKGWDGKEGGFVLPEGIYIYKCTANTLEGNDILLSGTITLVK